MGQPRLVAKYCLLLKTLPQGQGQRVISKNYEQLESYILSIDASRYASERNFLGGSTQLSEYITRGVISLPRVRELLLERNKPYDCAKLIQELAWREYWQRVWYDKGSAIFDYIRPQAEPRRSGLPAAILSAETGIRALDDGLRQLYETGYIHNHLRMWLAGLICNVARCDWRIGADWMISHLIDGDYASNHLSWQWVAGSYTGKQYLPQQDNINTFTRSLQRNTYLDTDYETIASMPVPQALQALVQPADVPKPVPFLPTNLVSISDIDWSAEVLLYSPWTLDPNWRRDSAGPRLLVLSTEQFTTGVFGQHVVDSIMSVAALIPDLKVAVLNKVAVQSLHGTMIRKAYPGIIEWPGQVDGPELLYPDVPEKPYNSFMSYWKQAEKSAR